MSKKRRSFRFTVVNVFVLVALASGLFLAATVGTAPQIGFSQAVAILLGVSPASPGGDRNLGPNADGKNTSSHETGFPNYDIRTDKADGARDYIAAQRTTANRSASVVSDIKDGFVRGEQALKSRVPDVKFEYNEDMGIPEVITPDVWKDKMSFLASAARGKKSEALRGFAKQNKELIGATENQLNQLKVTADYANPDGTLSYAVLEQTINGIPVFRGEIKAGFTRNGEMFRVINNFAPGLEYDALSADFHDPEDAVKAVASNIRHEFTGSELTKNLDESDSVKTVFGVGDWATTAEKVYFPTEPGVAVAAWQVLIWQPINAYYVIVDASTGTILWRKNITSHQTQPATYNVYTNPANMMNVANNPAPIVPGLNTPASGTQGTLIARNNVTLIGNEAPNTFNNMGWITDNTNGADGWTDGNNVGAGLDIVAPDGVDAPVNGAGRVFNFNYTPGIDAPTLPAYRSGAVTQLFYTTNRFHDETYKLGFTEAARNFQNTNFSGMGLGNDRVSAEAQDSSETNNAVFSTPADGSRGRMEMFVFTGPNPDIDGDLDNQIVVHELTHGMAGRLVGNGLGLLTNRAGGMNEGWADFYAMALLSDPSHPLAANYSMAGYATYLFVNTPTYTYNNYYGIRRFPYAIRSFTGGAGNLPHNPLTFADIDPAQANISDGAFAANPYFAPGNATDVHKAGEVWCSALWEVRARLITRLGAAPGNLKSLQLTTDGLKLTPNAPNFIQARDAIIAVAFATAGADAVDVREGFRIRGMGFGAQDNSPAVVESFVLPSLEFTDLFTVSDSTGDNDGVPEAGENVVLTFGVRNAAQSAASGVQANVNGGANVSYGNIPSGATVPLQIPYLIPVGTVCGSLHAVTINLTSSLGNPASTVKTFRSGVFGNTSYTGPPVAIPDSNPAGVNITLPVSGFTGTINDLDFGLDALPGCSTSDRNTNASVDHTFLSELSFKLTSPGGTTVNLITRRGGSGNNYCTLLLDDDGAFPAVSTISTTGAVAGNFAPESQLSAFDGQNPNGSWTLNVTDAVGGDIGSVRRFSLIISTDTVFCVQPPTLSITDVSGVEGTTFPFRVTLSNPAPAGGVTFDIATADGTAQDGSALGEDNDYVGTSLTGQTIPAGSTSYTFNVPVSGSNVLEPNETFVVNVTNASGAPIVDGQAQGIIRKRTLSINDVSVGEGYSGTTPVSFQVSLSEPAPVGGVSFDIATSDGTAQDDQPAAENADYIANSLTAQTIPEGGTSYTFTVLVNGDNLPEGNETFFVNMTNPAGAAILDGQGRGTIQNACTANSPVTNTSDSDNGSLRVAISSICSGGTINFEDGSDSGGTNFTDLTPDTITLTSGEIVINKNVTINGSGANLLSVSGNMASRIFIISTGSIVNINHLTLKNGNGMAGSGGAISNRGTTTITSSAVINNTAARGGAIFSLGPVTILSTTVSGNVASSAGGAYYDGSGSVLNVENSTISDNVSNGSLSTGAIDAFFPVNITNSTISGNSKPNGTDRSGGGIYHWPNGRPITITNSTITNNFAAGSLSAGGLSLGAGTMTIRSSIIAGNQGNTTQPDVVGAFTSSGYNLIGSCVAAGCASAGFTGPGDQFGTLAAPRNPMLGALASNGGPTRTHALLAGSPAIDKGINALALTTDQRGPGFARTMDLSPTNAADGTDIGAFEYGNLVPPTVTSIDDGDGDNIVGINTMLTYNVTFSEDIDGATVTATDFNNAGTSIVTVGTVSEGTPGVFSVQVTPTTAGTLILRIPTGSVISNLAGNNLVVPVQDTDTVNVVPETTTVVDGLGNLVITDSNGGTTNDNIAISCTTAPPPTTVVVSDLGNGLNQSIPLSSITGNIIVNTLGGNDTLTVNLSGCDFIPAGGLTFNGGAPTTAPGDKLNIVGGNQGTVNYNYTNASDGSVVMSNFGTITYTGLEPLSNTGTATDVIFNLPSASANIATMSDLGGGMTRLAAATFETTDFVTPSGAVTINRGHVNDALTVSSALPSFPTLNIGTALLPFRQIAINGTVTLAADKNLNGFANPGTALSGISVTGITATGTGAVSLTSGRDIFVNGGPGITVVNGNLTLNSNQQATPTPGYFYAVNVQSGTLTTSGRGNIVINAKGGSDTVAAPGIISSIGLYVTGTGSIRSTSSAADAGLITIDGRGGNTGATGTIGVRIEGPATIASVSGDISINGVGGDTIGVNGAVSSYGLDLSGSTASIASTGVAPNSASITITATAGNVTSSQAGSYGLFNGGSISTVDGPISVTGVGGNTTGVGTSGDLISAGVSISGTIASTGTGANAGSMTLLGTSGNTNVGFAQGFRQDGALSTIDGDISITGISSTCVDGCFGVSSRANISATGDGNVAITGTGGTATAATLPINGVHVRNGATVSTATGAIDITGTGGNTTNNAGFQLGGLLGTAGTLATTGGSVTVNTDTIFIDTTLGTITAAGRPVSLRQKTNNVAINLGSVVDTTPSTLELSDAELDRITAGTLNIGNALSGTITASADITRSAATNMTLVSDGDVIISGGQVNTGGGTLLLDPGVSPDAVKPTKSLTDVTASTLSFGSDLAIVINGTSIDTQYTQLNVVGAVNLTGVSLLLSGSHVPTAGQQFTIVENDGGDPITGAFNGLPEGTEINPFLGSATVKAKISYVGGSGNDAVLTTSLINTPPTANGQTVAAIEDTPIVITLTGMDAEDNNLTFALVPGSGPTSGTLSAISAPDCTTTVNVCTATVTYTPTLNYSGGDSFQFTVSDGIFTSTPAATVTINVAPVADTSFVVTKTADTNDGLCGVDCSLREAIAASNTEAGPQTITFAPAVFSVAQTITLTLGHLNISNGGTLTTISGPGQNLLTVSGNSISRVFLVNPGANAAINDLTASNGRADTGGGISNLATLSLTGVTIRDSSDTCTSGTGGGGIYSQGAVTVTNATVRNNSSSCRGGGLAINAGTASISGSTIDNNRAAQSGGLHNQGATKLINTTISSNLADALAGGISNLGTLSVFNSTISGNTGQGVRQNAGTSLRLVNTLIANNSAADCFRGTGTADATHSLIEGGTECINGLNVNNLSGDPLLSALADNGGTTRTQALLPGSIAINAGSNCVQTDTCTSAIGANLTTDQRSIARPQQTTTDIGAFESRGFTSALSSGNNQSTYVNTNFAGPLAVTVVSAFGEPVNGGQVIFTPPASGASASIAGNPATITGGTATSGTVTANNTVGGPYNVVASTSGGTPSIDFALTNVNPPPVINAAPSTTRQQGSPGTISPVAVVSDPNQSAGSLTVTATTAPAGITVTNIQNANGGITANIEAACGATVGPNTIVFTVEDANGGSATANFTLTVTANTAPVLTHGNASVQNLASTTVSPAAFSDNGTATAALLSLGTYTGTISVSPAGVVSISNAGPIGTHTITVQATDNCGVTTDSSFTLNVLNNNPTITAAAQAGRQQGTAAAVSPVGTVGDLDQTAGTLMVTTTTIPVGLTVANIINTNGAITAEITALCNATVGVNTIVFTVTDSHAASATSNFTVNVTVNTPPTFTYINPAAIGVGTGTTMTPATLADNGGAGSLTFAIQSVSPLLITAPSVNAAGVVSITNAQPAGNHVIAVRATDACGAFTDASFTLTVEKANPTISTQASAGITLGSGTITDTATVAGRVAPIAGATITFNVYGPNDATCATSIFTSTVEQPVGNSPVVSAPFTPPAAGTYRWIASYSGDANNNPVSGACNEANESVVVGKAPLTVTADPKTRVYGQANPPFTATISGFVLGQNLATSGVTGSPAFTTNPVVSAASAPGDYAIIPSIGTLASANYSFTFVNGNLAIGRAATTTVITNAAALAATSAAVGLPYTVNFAVAVTAPGAGVPTGEVTVSDGAGATCFGAVAANGTGSCQLTSTTVGPKAITATYPGDTNFTGSVSPAATATTVILIGGNVKQFVANGVNTNLSGVTMTLTSGNAIVSTGTTDAGGNYVFGLVNAGGSYVVTPALANKVFEPISRTFANVTTSITNADFVAYDVPGPNANPRLVRVVNTTTTPGQSVTVPLEINAVGNERAMNLSLTYDMALLGTPTSVTCGSGATNCTVTINTSQPGRVGVTFTHPTPLAAGLREFARITFPTSNNTAANAEIAFGDQPLTRDIRDGAANPLPAFYARGFVTFNQPNQPNLGLEGDVVDANGNPTGGDGVGANDVSMIRQFALGLITPTNVATNQYQRADVGPRDPATATFGDGAINASDVTVIRLYALGILPPTAAAGPTGPVNTLNDEGDRINGTDKSNETNAIEATAIRVANSQGSPGGEVTIPIDIDAAGSESSMTFTLNWNPAVLTYVSSTLGPDAPTGANLGTNPLQTTNGKLGVLVDSVNTFESGTRRVMTVTFAVAPNAPLGTYPLTFSADPTIQSVSTNIGSLIQASFQAGSFIAVSDSGPITSTISGKVLTPEGAGLRNAVVKLIAANGTTRTATTSAFGIYTFENVTTGQTYTLTVTSKRFRFTPRQLSVNGNLAGVDLVGLQ